MQILIADDHEVVRKGIRWVLDSEPTLTVCGDAFDGRDAVEKALELRPDVIIMDISMPRLNGLEATRKIKRLLPDIEIVIVSQHDAPEMAREAFKAGALAYVVKSTIATELLAAIAKVSKREPFVMGVAQANTNHALEPKEILRRSADIERALREREERFRSTLNNMAEGLYTVDTEELVTYVNPSAEAMLGWTSAELLGKKIHEVTHYKHVDGTPFPASDCPGLRALRKGVELREHEDVFIRKDGTLFPVVFNASPLKMNGTIYGLVVCFRDDRKHREDEEAWRLRAAIVDSSGDAIISKNLDGVITSWNRGAARMFGYRAEEAIGRHITLIIPADRWDEEKTILEQLRRGEPLEHFETIRMHKDGTMLDISLTVSPVRDVSGRVVGASKVARDITEQKQAQRELRKSEEQLRMLADGLETQVHLRTEELERRNAEILQQSEQLRELSNRLLRTQDQERRRIARELHDGVGQLLAALSMNLSTLNNEKAKLSDQAGRSLDENLSLIEQASKEIRTMSHLLHPPLLDEVGLESALCWFVDGFSERSKITVDIEMAPGFSDGLRRDLALSLFRIVQECLTNVHRHSGSLTAFVRIDRSSSEITLEVKDDGVGVPPEIRSKLSSGQSSGVGLRGMRERIRQFGGRLEIHSDGKGTRIVAVLPVTEATASNDEVADELQK